MWCKKGRIGQHLVRGTHRIYKELLFRHFIQPLEIFLHSLVDQNKIKLFCWKWDLSCAKKRRICQHLVKWKQNTELLCMYTLKTARGNISEQFCRAKQNHNAQKETFMVAKKGCMTNDHTTTRQRVHRRSQLVYIIMMVNNDYRIVFLLTKHLLAV